MIYRVFYLLFAGAAVFALSPPSSRTSPPSGAKIVRAGTSTSGEYATLAAAIAALPNDSTSQTIFLYPGTYTGQVLIDRSGPVTVRYATRATATGSQISLNSFWDTLQILERTRPTK